MKENYFAEETLQYRKYLFIKMFQSNGFVGRVFTSQSKQ